MHFKTAFGRICLSPFYRCHGGEGWAAGFGSGEDEPAAGVAGRLFNWASMLWTNNSIAANNASISDSEKR